MAVVSLNRARHKCAPHEPTDSGRVVEDDTPYIEAIILSNTVLVCSLDLHLNQHSSQRDTVGVGDLSLTLQ